MQHKPKRPIPFVNFFVCFAAFVVNPHAAFVTPPERWAYVGAAVGPDSPRGFPHRAVIHTRVPGGRVGSRNVRSVVVRDAMPAQRQFVSAAGRRSLDVTEEIRMATGVPFDSHAVAPARESLLHPAIILLTDRVNDRDEDGSACVRLRVLHLLLARREAG